MDRLFYSAAAWTGIGLLAGLYNRELTRGFENPPVTMLSGSHTHALALGTLLFLAVLALSRVFAFSDKALRLFTILWNTGLGMTFGMMVVKGTLQVLGHDLATSKALAGVAGLGHMLITGTMVYFFLSLRKAMKASDAEPALPLDA